MKKIREKNTTAKKQMLNGLVYMALAVTVVSVAIGGVISSFDNGGESVTENKGATGNSTIYNGDYSLKAPESEVKPSDFNLDTPVSDSPSGVDASITDTSEDTAETVIKDTTGVPDDTAGAESEIVSVPQDGTVTEEAASEYEYGFDGFIRPCSGYIGKEFSMDVPVYSVSMYDYRTHEGIDIVGEVGTPVKAASNGEISDIYHDYFYGTTVVISHKDGISSYYSNLSADLPADLEVGRRVITGEVIGGIGETAMCEAADASHLHFSMTLNGEYVNPEDYFVN